MLVSPFPAAYYTPTENTILMITSTSIGLSARYFIPAGLVFIITMLHHFSLPRLPITRKPLNEDVFKIKETENCNSTCNTRCSSAKTIGVTRPRSNVLAAFTNL
jgi:hypothetical protein